eukprot:6487838-Pyramimonas_sp.AAC.1
MGEVLAVPTSFNENRTYMLMSCATRIEAVHLACEADPENLQVIKTLEAGISGITVLDPRSTED